MAPSSTWSRPCLLSRAFLAGDPLLGLRGTLLGGHSERSRGGEACGWNLGGDGARCGASGCAVSGAEGLHTQFSFQVMSEAGQPWPRLLLVALALALVAKKLASPHAQEALGTGIRAHGEWGVRMGSGCKLVSVRTRQGGLNQ